VLLVEFSPMEAVAGRFPYSVTLRKATCSLLTGSGNVLVKHGSIVAKGDVLGTENLIVPKTADIVAGLPKIVGLFEATQNSSLRSKAEKYFEEAKKSMPNLAAALEATRLVRRDFVAEVQSTYLSQGVMVNSKHIELLGRRMTGTCEVVTSTCPSLRPGQLVDFLELEALQALGTKSGKVTVRPRVRGITKLGKEENHILVAMGFREINNIAVQCVLGSPKMHLLDGVKENLMIGKAIQAGSNSSVAARIWKDAEGISAFEKLDVTSFPEWEDGATALGHLNA